MDQILFLRNCASTKLRGCGTLVTSDHGEARFWVCFGLDEILDLFGPDEPLGSFPLTQNPEEQVVALSCGRRLITGSRYGDVKVWNYIHRGVSEDAPPRPQDRGDWGSQHRRQGPPVHCGLEQTDHCLP